MPITSPGMALPASLPGALDTPVGGGTGGSVPPAPPPIVFLIRTPTCILVVDGIDVPALAFTASFGFDRHYSEASVTVGPTSVPTYWSVVELYADAVPRLSPTLRFRGRLRRQPRDLWPKGGTLACAGNLYRAALYKNTAPAVTILGSTIWPGGTDMVGTVLTGTVAKAAGSATLTGTGTAFLGDCRRRRAGRARRHHRAAHHHRHRLEYQPDGGYAYDYDASWATLLAAGRDGRNAGQGRAHQGQRALHAGEHRRHRARCSARSAGTSTSPIPGRSRGLTRSRA
jgi:hypothetical protein